MGDRQSEDILSGETVGDLPPVGAGVLGFEHAAEFLVVYDSGVDGVGVTLVHGDG